MRDQVGRAEEVHMPKRGRVAEGGGCMGRGGEGEGRRGGSEWRWGGYDESHGCNGRDEGTVSIMCGEKNRRAHRLLHCLFD